MNDDNEPAFINRHGKAMTADGPVLEVVPEEKPFVPERPEKVQKVRRKRSGRPKKKFFMIVLAVLVGILLIPVLGGEMVRAGYVSSRNSAKTQLTDYAAHTVVPQQKKQVTVAQLSQTADKVEAIRDGACAGGLADNLANLYPRAASALRDCITLKQKIAAIATCLRDMESQARYLESLGPVLEPVSKGSSDEFAVISAQLTNWQTLSDGLAKLSPAASQQSAHTELKAEAKTIVDAWSELNTANSNQDGAAFTAAEKKLSAGYEAFRMTRTRLAKLLIDTQASLSASYSEIK